MKYLTFLLLFIPALLYAQPVSYPIVEKQFMQTPVAIGSMVPLQIKITNTGTETMNNVSISDVLPTTPGPMTISVNNPDLFNGAGGTLSAPPGGSTISLTGGTVAAGTTVVIVVDVDVYSPGYYFNSTSDIEWDEPAGHFRAPGASHSLDVRAPLIFEKSFSPASIANGGTTNMIFRFTNPNELTFTGINFSDTFPPGMAVASPLAIANTCGGTLRNRTNTGPLSAGDTGLQYTGGSINPYNGTCTITIAITSTATGINSTSMASCNECLASSTPATAVLTVGTPLSSPTVAQAFSPVSVGTNTPSTLTVTLTNPNSSALTVNTLAETLPSGLSTASSGTTTCAGGTVTTTAGGISLSGGTIPANGSCTITVDVSSPTANTYNSSTGTLTTTQGVSGSPASATLTVTGGSNPVLSLTKNCSSPINCTTSPQLPGTDLTYSIIFTNTGSANAINIHVADAIPNNTDFKTGTASTTATFPFTIEYSNDGGTTWTYSPISGGGGAPTGYDRAVTTIRLRQTGGIFSSTATAELSFTTRIR